MGQTESHNSSPYGASALKVILKQMQEVSNIKRDVLIKNQLKELEEALASNNQPKVQELLSSIKSTNNKNVRSKSILAALLHSRS